MKRQILLIDDDEDELEIFTEALDKLPLSCDCMLARNTEQAIELLNQFKPDFVFIDFNMPKTNGLQSLQELKAMKQLEGARFIIYSNFIDEQTRQKAVLLGATCMKKPYMTSILAERLKEVFMNTNA